MGSNSEAIVYLPGGLRDIVLVQVLFGVIPAYGVQGVFNLKHHSREGAHSWQVGLLIDRLVIRIEHKGGVGSILLVKAAKNEDGGGSNLVGHSEIAGNPILFVLHVDNFPDVFLYIIAFADVSDFLRAELDAAAKDVDKLSVEDAAGG